MRDMMSMGSVEPTLEYSTASLPLVMGGTTGGRGWVAADVGAGALVGVDVGVTFEGQTPIRGIPGLGVVLALPLAVGVVVGVGLFAAPGVDVPLAAPAPAGF